MAKPMKTALFAV